MYETQVCVTCHVPAIVTSGRGIADATISTYKFTKAEEKILADWKFDRTLPNAALAVYGFLPASLVAIGTLWGLGELLLASPIGARLYRETEA